MLIHNYTTIMFQLNFLFRKKLFVKDINVKHEMWNNFMEFNKRIPFWCYYCVYIVYKSSSDDECILPFLVFLSTSVVSAYLYFKYMIDLVNRRCNYKTTNRQSFIKMIVICWVTNFIVNIYIITKSLVLISCIHFELEFINKHFNKIFTTFYLLFI